MASKSSHHNWVGTDAELLGVFADLGFVSASPCMLPLLHQAWRAARVSDAALLLEGETGTGKQALADAIYRLDPKRSGSPFVTLHCGAIQESLAETELFGHERGAFSGAVSNRQGLFQSANKGTLFLDDVNDLPPTLQPKLLDILQRGKVRAVGSDRELPLDVRVIAASNQPLAPLVRDGRFRADLYYRLDVIRLSLPPLRERPHDVPALIMAFSKRHVSLYAPIDSISEELVRHLELHLFPGNIRELEHAVQRMLFAKSEGSTLTLEDWSQQESGSVLNSEGDFAELTARVRQIMVRTSASFESVFREVDKRIVEGVLAGGGTRKQVASQLGISERKLYRRVRNSRNSER